MQKIITLALLSTSAAILYTSIASAGGTGGGPPPVMLVECGESDSKTATYITVGTYCTSNSGNCGQGNRDRARTDANNNFDAGINSTHQCKSCMSGDPPQPQVCEPSLTKTPAAGYADSDCVCTYAMPCQGNPLKTLVTMTCTASLSWSYDCSDPCSN